MNFEKFYGNNNIKEYLSSAFERNAFPHALLITGEAGIGKRTLADIVSRALVCTGDDVPCGKCDACKKAANKTHPDIIRLGESGESLKVDAIRSLKRDVLLLPNDGERKVYIINHAETMTHEAQDAFLKILEEPPLFTSFIILCYNLSDLLPTVISRAVHITLSPLSDSEICRVIEEKLPDISEEMKDRLIQTSGGICSFLIEEKNREHIEASANIAAALVSRDEFDIYRAVAVLEKHNRDALISVLDELTVIVRDACILSSDAESTLISNADPSLAKRFSQVFSPKDCCEIIDHISHAKNCCERNIGVSHITGSLICKLAHSAANAASKG